MTIYDNNGKTFDRYTVFIGKNCFGMSQNPLSPQGFNQWAGDDIEPGKHLGREIPFEDLPGEVKEAILKREQVEKVYAN